MTASIPRARIRLPLLAIVAAAVGLIAARMVWPKLLFDTTSLILFGIAALAWALAYLPITKLKVFDLEAELEPLVAKLEQKVIASEAEATVRATKDTEKRPGVVYRREPGFAEDSPGGGGRAALEEFAEILESNTPDEARVIRAANLLWRVANDRELSSKTWDAVHVVQSLRIRIEEEGYSMSPQDAKRVLDGIGRLIRMIVGE